MTPQNLLDAMDGVSLLLDRELRIAAVGWPNWDDFLSQNGGPDHSRHESRQEPRHESGHESRHESRRRIVGRHVCDFFTGDDVRETFRRAFERVLASERGELRVTYRCDAPDVERLMRLSVTRVESDAGATLLYQSVLLHATERPPLGLFGVPVRPSGAGDLLTICSLCAQVAWPKGAPAERREWIEAPEYYRRGGAEVAALSHGFCPDCFDRLMAEIA